MDSVILETSDTLLKDFRKVVDEIVYNENQLSKDYITIESDMDYFNNTVFLYSSYCSKDSKDLSPAIGSYN